MCTMSKYCGCFVVVALDNKYKKFKSYIDEVLSYEYSYTKRQVQFELRILDFFKLQLRILKWELNKELIANSKSG